MVLKKIKLKAKPKPKPKPKARATQMQNQTQNVTVNVAENKKSNRKKQSNYKPSTSVSSNVGGGGAGGPSTLPQSWQFNNQSRDNDVMRGELNSIKNKLITYGNHLDSNSYNNNDKFNNFFSNTPYADRVEFLPTTPSTSRRSNHVDLGQNKPIIMFDADHYTNTSNSNASPHVNKLLALKQGSYASMSNNDYKSPAKLPSQLPFNNNSPFVGEDTDGTATHRSSYSEPHKSIKSSQPSKKSSIYSSTSSEVEDVYMPVKDVKNRPGYCVECRRDFDRGTNLRRHYMTQKHKDNMKIYNNNLK
jgi:hypothetical protein